MSRDLTQYEVMLYEVRASWWAPYVSWTWLQRITGRYFAWKARRKWRRYTASFAEGRRVGVLPPDPKPVAAHPARQAE
jgi:hypothetical protein